MRDPFSYGDVPTRVQGLRTRIRALKALLQTRAAPALQRTARQTLRQLTAELAATRKEKD